MVEFPMGGFLCVTLGNLTSVSTSQMLCRFSLVMQEELKGSYFITILNVGR